MQNISEHKHALARVLRVLPDMDTMNALVHYVYQSSDSGERFSMSIDSFPALEAEVEAISHIDLCPLDPHLFENEVSGRLSWI